MHIDRISRTNDRYYNYSWQISFMLSMLRYRTVEYGNVMYVKVRMNNVHYIQNIVCKKLTNIAHVFEELVHISQ